MLDEFPSGSERSPPVSALARWCYRRRTVVLVAWIVALVGLAVAALGAGTAFTDSAELPDSESSTAYSLLADAGLGASVDGSTETGTIVWQTDGLAVDDPAVQADVTAVLDEIAALPQVEAVVSPYSAEGAHQLAAASSTAFATVTVAADADVAQITELAQTMQSSTLDVEVGDIAFTPEPGASGGTEAIGILAALVILVLVFRSVWAAALPIITGLVGVGTSLLIVMLASHAVDLAATSLTMGALIGLGVGIDYALFIVNRYRKALLAGSSVPDAISTALNTSGRAVIFAGLTVVVALLAMVVVNLGILTGMAQAAAVTVVFTVLTAITLLPALLGLLGTKVLSHRQRAALLADPSGAAAACAALLAKPGLAARWAGLVQRAPRRLAALALVAIVILALPVTAMRVGAADASSDPEGSGTKNYFDMMSSAYGDGFEATLLLVATTPDAASAQAFADLTASLSTVENVATVAPAPAQPGQTLSVATVVPTTSAQTEETQDLVTTLRDDVIPEASAGTDLQVYVAGTTATNIDLSEALMSKLPLYLGIIAVLGFLLLALAFRSVLVPLVGALSNLATIVVGLGAITAIFQLGWGSELLGVGSGAPVMYIVPVLIVGVMFGLSMDYQVFLVSRMHEEWTQTKDNARAVRVGVSETGQVVAAAALIMLCVFASFGFSGQRIVAGIGMGMAIAVVVDAFVVRMTLVPAIMTLVGRRNWSYPRWAERVTPHLSIDGPSEPAAATSGDASDPDADGSREKVLVSAGSTWDGWPQDGAAQDATPGTAPRTDNAAKE